MTMSAASVSSSVALPATDPGVIPAIVKDARETFESGRTRPLTWRLAQLNGIARMMKECEQEIYAALAADLCKPEMEAMLAEVSFCLKDAETTAKALPGWMKPKKVRTPLVAQPGKSYLYRDPLGVVLVIAPWNYPVQLCVGPLIGALAAGNSVVVKPSELAPATSAFLARRLPQYVDPAAVKVVEGAITETTALLEQRFDHIFYTGNGKVARVVMAAAAKHLTPVTLELGGKSPCYVDPTADLRLTARRIVWGKFFNAGQTCVAPDYILAHEAIHDSLLEQLKDAVREFYGTDPQQSRDFARVVNTRHHQRLMRLIGSGTPVCGGQADEQERYIAPTVLRDVAPDSAVMGEEIFGPILPVLKVRGPDDAIRSVLSRDKPLALYVFTRDETVAERFLQETSAGGVTVNHVWMHLGVPELPFGGVGESGMGRYHGRFSFECFTHEKAVLKKPLSMDPPIMYPPYTLSKQKWVKRLA